MLRHPRYLEIPWEVHWGQRNQKESEPHHRMLLILTLTLHSDVLDRDWCDKRPDVDL
jgi:hypothetical protein